MPLERVNELEVRSSGTSAVGRVDLLGGADPPRNSTSADENDGASSRSDASRRELERPLELAAKVRGLRVTR